ncbi:MAG: response regulator [Candidatus Omnitrophota bacterium]|jgi:CheY-like chemotaxis protein
MDKKKILIIDDEEDFTKLIKSNLELTGNYEVKTENKSMYGFIAAKEFKPDLILLDVMMPGMDGGDVCNQLGGDRDTKDIPVVFLTAVVKQDEIKEKNGVIGGRAFISKPIDVEKLVDIIEKNIR